MTTKQRKLRLAVAADVIASLKYLEVYAGNGYILDIDPSKLHFTKGSKVVAREIQKQGCEVCALGACVLSLVALDNDFDFLKASGESAENFNSLDLDHFRDRLLEVFSPVQLCLIETAFERDEMGARDVDNLDSDDLQPWLEAAIKFGNKFGYSSKRLRAIMKNILDNNGVFTPPLPKPDLKNIE